jgi:putative transposase
MCRNVFEMNPVRAKPHRLPEAMYHGKRTVAFTACIEERQRPFEDPELVAEFLAILQEATVHWKCLVPIYCFMPDHVHMLIQGTESASRPKKAMERFKYESGCRFKRSYPHYEWQGDFYDRILRASEWKKQAFYVLQNPMRAGLVEDPYSYPHTGSIGYDLVELLHEISW